MSFRNDIDNRKFGLKVGTHSPKVKPVGVEDVAMRGVCGGAEIAELAFEAPVMKPDEIFEIEQFLDSILMRGWLRVEIPDESKALWSFCVLQVLDMIVANKESVRAWALMQTMQFLLLQRPGKLRGKGAVMRVVHNRMLRFVKWNIKELLEEAQQQWLENKLLFGVNESGDAECAKSGETQRSRRLLMDGRWADSLKEIMLNGGGVRRRPSAETEKLLKEKIEASVQNMPSDVDSLANWRRIQAAEGFEKSVMTEVDFAKLFGATDKCRGPGLSGMTYGQMNDALRAAETRQRLNRGYAAVITLVMNGEVPKMLWPYWFGGRAGIAGKDGRRLFVAGESLQKLAERWAIKALLQKKKLFKYNVGVGFSGAADYIAAWAQKVREDHKDKKGLVFVEIDAANMFLELVRKEVLKLVKERAPELFPFVMHLTGPMFISMFHGKQLEEIKKGISIGSSASSLIASLVGEVLLEEVDKKCQEEHVWALFLAFIDNIFIATTVEQVDRILRHLQDMGRKYGLIYEIRKEHPHKICFVNVGDRHKGKMSAQSLKNNVVKFKGFEVSAMWNESDLAQETASTVEAYPASKRGLVLAGVPVGTEEFHAAEWARKMTKVKQQVAVLVNGVHPKEAVLMLRKCVALRMGFQARMAGEVVKACERAREFDDVMLKAVQTMAEGSGDWAEEVVKRLWLLVWWKLGGLEHSVVPAKLAAISSVSDNGIKPDQNVITHLYGLFNSRVMPEDQLVHKKRDQMLSELKALAPKVQKKLTERVLRRKRVALLEKIKGTRDELLFEEVTREDANLWRDQPSYSSVLPPKESERQNLDPEDFGYGVRRRMPGANPHGLPKSLAEGEGIQCLARSANGNVCKCLICGGIVDHAEMLCYTIRGAGKHSALVRCSCEVSSDLGVTAVVTKLEPKGLVPIPGAKMHVDVRISGLQGHVPIVVDVANKSRFAAGARACFMEDGEAKKVKDYAERYAKGGERFIPFVTGGHGGFGEKAWQLIKLFAQRLQAVQGIPVAKGEVIIKTLFQCRVEKQIAANGAKFFKRHEELINTERLKENDAVRKKEEDKRRRADHARQNLEHDKALAEMVERGNPNQQHRMDLPPMLGSQDVAMMARAAAATASPPQAPSGPSQLQNAVKEAAVRIKIVMEKTAKVPKGTGLGNLMPL